MSKHIFNRKIYQQMLQWKAESKGKSALLVEGARRVGKSTQVRLFAQQEYASFIMIDFADLSPEVDSLIENHLSDLNYLFMRLQLLFRTPLYERKSVIIFDEVQLKPKVRQAIKYLVQDGRYDYIETGSLISLKRNVQDIVIPSEEDRLQMFPMDFEEFLWALGDETTIPLLRQFFANPGQVGDEVHRRLMRDFRLYMLVGGMPQAVDTFIDSNNLMQVDRIKRRILNLYADDLHKLDASDKLKALFWAIPSSLSRMISRFQPTTVLENIKQGTMQELLEALRESMIVNIACHSSDPNVGLALTADRRRYKMYLADTGLFVTLAFWDKGFTENTIYQKLLADKLPANLGYVFENVVAQMLRASGYELYYHTFPSSGNHYYEIDFLLSKGRKLTPIEVKSSGYNSHKSLDAFCEKYASRVGDRYLLYTKDFRKDGATTCLPVYFTPQL
jgi:hypothetical protein